MLTFKNGSFQLNNKVIPLKEAVRHQAESDQVAKKVFNRILVKRFKAPAGPLPSFLDSHQKEGVVFTLSRSRSYLAHAPGAGKTCEAIVASMMANGSNGRNQTIFIVPPTLTQNWAREILKWTGTPPFNFWPSIYVVGRSEFEWNADWNANFIIVPDSMLTKGWVYDNLQKRRCKLLAVDEASRFKEATAERTKALFGGVGDRVYYGLIPNARHAVLLDGSPMPNRPLELWAPVTGMAGETIDFMSLHDFGVRYCNGRFIADQHKLDWDYSGASNRGELRERLKPFMHVVTEEKLNHPERKRSLLFMNTSGASDIKSWEQKHLLTLNGINPKKIDEDMSLGAIAQHRQRIGLSKTQWVAEYVRGRLETKNESILIFAWHRDVCRDLEHRLRAFKPALVIGGMDARERENVFQRFQLGTCRVIIGNIAAMGRGHNLQRASRVVFAEYSWTDELNKQCEKRASRKGSTNQFVRCDYVVAAGTMDETVLNAVFTKAKNVKRIVG